MWCAHFHPFMKDSQLFLIRSFTYRFPPSSLPLPWCDRLREQWLFRVLWFWNTYVTTFLLYHNLYRSAGSDHEETKMKAHSLSHGGRKNRDSFFTLLFLLLPFFIFFQKMFLTQSMPLYQPKESLLLSVRMWLLPEMGMVSSRTQKFDMILNVALLKKGTFSEINGQMVLEMTQWNCVGSIPKGYLAYL